MFFKQVLRRDDIAYGFGHFLAVGVKYPARNGGVRPGKAPVLQIGAHDRREQPGPDDVVALRAQVHGEDPLPPVTGRGVFPSAGDLGRERGGGPGVHHVHFGRETAWNAALARRVARRDICGGVDGEIVFARHEGARIVRLAILVQAVPDGERYAEKALPADQPVAV